MAHGLQCLGDVCKGWRAQHVGNHGWYDETIDGAAETVLESRGPLQGCLEWALIYFDGFVQPFMNFIIGGLWLCATTQMSELILNATALHFVSQLDDFVVTS